MKKNVCLLSTEEQQSTILSYLKNYLVHSSNNVMSCVSRIYDYKPEVFILSHSITQEETIEIIKDLRTSSIFNEMLIVLILENNSINPEEYINIGCNDFIYLTELDGISSRIENSLRSHKEKISLQQQANYAQQVAMTAMTSMGEIGIVLQFLSKCFLCGDYKSVVNEVLESMQQYNLKGSVQVRTEKEFFTINTENESSEEDISAIENLYRIGRLFEFKNKMVVNYEHLSILLNNVTVDNDTRGRIRDNIAMLAEGANARIVSLLIEKDNIRKQNGIRYALSQILEMAADLQTQQHSTRDNGNRAVNHVIQNFESYFIHLGLSEEQESKIIDMLYELRKEVQTLGINEKEIEDKLNRVVLSLQSIAEEDL